MDSLSIINEMDPQSISKFLRMAPLHIQFLSLWPSIYFLEALSSCLCFFFVFVRWWQNDILTAFERHTFYCSNWCISGYFLNSLFVYQLIASSENSFSSDSSHEYCVPPENLRPPEPPSDGDEYDEVEGIYVEVTHKQCNVEKVVTNFLLKIFS